MAAFAFGAGRHARRPGHLVGGAANWGAMLIHDCLVQPIRAVVISIGDRAWYREHRVERQGETLMTARAAGTPTRLVRSNPLFSVLLFGATTRTRVNPGPAGLPSQKGSRKTLPVLGDATEEGTPTEPPWPRLPLEPGAMLEDPDTWLGAPLIGVPC